MRLRLQQILKNFGATPVLRGVSLNIEPHELFFLLGPSGCGKTTLLRIIAGFYQPDSGDLHFGERRMNGVEPHLRNTGMVFQNYALWPHLSVEANVAYGLDVRGVSAAESRSRVADALRTVRMEDYAGRSPNQLSGGQQQRVALARALVIRPDVLLLDEPLSNLDARLRLEMRDEIKRIHAETRLTTVYVTHDQKEALSMADRIAVLKEGAVEQLGAPRELYRRPATRFVGDFIGEANWLAGRITEVRAGTLTVETSHGTVRLPEMNNLTAGQTVDLGFRPEATRFDGSPAGGDALKLSGHIESLTYLGEAEQILIRLGDGTLVRASESDPREIRSAGAVVSIQVPASSVFVVRA